jgi:hypothetical protein
LIQSVFWKLFGAFVKRKQKFIQNLPKKRPLWFQRFFQKKYENQKIRNLKMTRKKYLQDSLKTSIPTVFLSFKISYLRSSSKKIDPFLRGQSF